MATTQQPVRMAFDHENGVSGTRFAARQSQGCSPKPTSAFLLADAASDNPWGRVRSFDGNASVVVPYRAKERRLRSRGRRSVRSPQQGESAENSGNIVRWDEEYRVERQGGSR